MRYDIYIYIYIYMSLGARELNCDMCTVMSLHSLTKQHEKMGSVSHTKQCLECRNVSNYVT